MIVIVKVVVVIVKVVVVIVKVVVKVVVEVIIKKEDGKRSPSYFKSVRNNRDFNTNDPTIYVSNDNIILIDKLYQYLKNINRGLEINSSNISMIIVRAIEFVNTWEAK